MSLAARSLDRSAPGASGLAEVNGTKLHYELYGSGPPVLLLHGFGLDRRMWRPQVEALSKRHLVICYDARGFGRSANPGPRPYSHFTDAAALLRYLELGPVLAVGHSVGAHQLLELSLARPDLVNGLVALCPSGLSGLALPPDMAQLERDLRVTARTSGVSSAKRQWAGSACFRSLRDSSPAKLVFEQLLADYSGWHWTHDSTERSLQTSAARLLNQLRVPCLVITGGRDLAYHVSVGRALVRGIPDAESLELPEAGHLANLEAPDEVSSAILSFARARLCDSVPPPSTERERESARVA
jgi:3-oxoadipate enol-lactonase